ncbi:hypothetical protein [Streptomyces sp. NPDC093097]|uniref:hypothetical protein n=1 Tax=Streptomyces sp. NPDC093097 TaxID=3366027 RepID=UPI00382F55CB
MEIVVRSVTHSRFGAGAAKVALYQLRGEGGLRVAAREALAALANALDVGLAHESRDLLATHADAGAPERPTSDTPHLTPHQNERHFGVGMSPVTPTPHITRTRKTAGQKPYLTRSRITTHST